MRKALAFIALGFVAGIGMAALFGRDSLPAMTPPPAISRAAPTASTPASDRIAALETALAAEAERRAQIEADVAGLAARVDALRDTPADGGGVSSAADPNVVVEIDEGAGAGRLSARVAQRRERASPEYRINRLIEAGFAPDQAQWILDRESQLRMDRLNAQYEARREGQPFNPLTDELEGQSSLRTDLGDEAYARYLDAMGMPSSVPVLEVLDSSPAQAAGLRSGDEIVSYDGQRVFNLIELNQLTLAGEPGETVVVDILRDGQTMQLYMPRGPIGFAGGGRNFVFGTTAPFIP